MAKSTKNASVSSILASASKLASYNMMLQLSFRVLTFVLNAFVLRYVTKDILGIVNVRLVLLYSTILFMSREAFRRACLSHDITSEESTKKVGNKWIQMINLLWITIPIGFVFSVCLTYCWINILDVPNPKEVPHYPFAAITFGLCGLLELFVEPLWIIGQSFLFVKLKVVSEGLAMLAKCLITVPLIVYFPHWGLISFSITMVVFSVVYILIYYGYFIWFIKSGNSKKMDNFPLQNVRDIFPQFHDHGFIDRQYAFLTVSFMKQSILKQFLTEGERYVMTILNVLSFSDQGIYDVINNLGSLAARFIFLPIEESFYLFFAKTLQRGKSAQVQSKEQMNEISKVLFFLLRFVVLIGLIILSFGLPFSHLLLDIYGGSLLSTDSGPVLLRVYCLYVLVIAINGTTECFVFAAMSQRDVDSYNKKMLMFSIVFLLSSYYLTINIGSVGFILANCLNMITRIIHSVWFIKRFYENSDIPSPLLGLFPNRTTMTSLLISCIICSYSEKRFCCAFGWIWRLVHIGCGFTCLCCVFFTIWFTEKDLINFLKRQYFSKKSD